MTKKIMRVRSVLDVSVGISVWLFYSSTFRDDGRIQPKTQKKKLFERSIQQASVGVCRQNGNIIKKNILAFRILVLHNNQRCATISALLHIDLNINTSIFIILIANVISKWLVHAQRTCISALVVPFYQTGEQKKTHAKRKVCTNTIWP